jgi:hypothetical protein
MELDTAKHVRDYWAEAIQIGEDLCAKVGEEDKEKKTDDRRHPEVLGRAATLAYVLTEARRLWETMEQIQVGKTPRSIHSLISFCHSSNDLDGQL